VNDERPWLNINKLAALFGRPALELRQRLAGAGRPRSGRSLSGASELRLR
jgi:hypothetical protein